MISRKNDVYLPKIGENSTIGLRIRRRRLELKLEQKDVAEILGATECSISGWEIGRYEPQIQYVPKIISFLGYNPYQFETETLGGRIKYYRLMNGIRIELFAETLGVNVSTVRAWENDTSLPRRLRILKQLTEILQTIPEKEVQAMRVGVAIGRKS